MPALGKEYVSLYQASHQDEKHTIIYDTTTP
jgi:hypothetical protein